MPIPSVGFIENVNLIADKLDIISTSNALFDINTIEVLQNIQDLNLQLIVEDLVKGNYLGNRKIDIDISLNNSSWGTDNQIPVYYDSANIILKDGTHLNIPFLNISGTSTEEQSTPGGILRAITDHVLYAQVTNTEFIEELGVNGGENFLRFRDSDGLASNVDVVTLNAVSGPTYDSAPDYYWTLTTSSLQTLSNRVGDLIAIGNEIDNIIGVSNLSTEIEALYDIRNAITALDAIIAEILSVNSNSANINTVSGSIVNVNTVGTDIDNVNTVATNVASVNTVSASIANVNHLVSIEASKLDPILANEGNINTVVDTIIPNMAEILVADDNAATAIAQATIATNKAGEAAASALDAANSASDALDHLNDITALNTTANTLTAGSSATASYNSATGLLTFGIPQGIKGDRGEAFTIDASGTIAERTAYDGASKGFSYLSLDETPTKVYFKASDTSGDWTTGVEFGKGEIGDTGPQGLGWLSGSGIPDNGTGLDGEYYLNTDNADVYIKSGGSWAFSLNLAGSINDTVTDLNLTWSSFKINTLLANKSDDDHTHTGVYEAANVNIQTHVTDVATNPHNVTKAQVGLGSVDNTSDANKPISVATQSALDLKAPLASPALTGIPTVPTAPTDTATTQIASTAFVQQEIINNSAPSTVLSEIPPTSPSAGQEWFNSTNGHIYIWYEDGNSGQWIRESSVYESNSLLTNLNLADVDNAAIALSNIGGAPLASPTFTGTVTLPTATVVNIVTDTTPQLGGDLDCNGNQITDSSYVQIADATLGTGTHTFNYASGDMQQLTATGNITLATSNFVTGAVCSMIIDAVNFGAYTITHPAAWLFAAGTAPTYTAAGTDRLLLLKDKDEIITLHVIGQDIKAV